jgi:Kef-type K+ transport system membrane component KefB
MSSHSTEWLSAMIAAQVAVVLVVAQSAAYLFRRMRQPAVIGEIAAGIALGPSLLGLLPGNLTEVLFPAETRPALAAIAQLGVLLFMFVVGWEFDARLIRGRGRATVGTLAVAFVVPMSLGVAFAAAAYSRYGVVGGDRVPFTTFALYLGVTLSITAFPVLARIIADHRLQGTSIGTSALALAAGSDLLGWTALAVVVATTSSRGAPGLGLHLAFVATYLAVMVLVVRPLLVPVCRRLLSSPGRERYLIAVAVPGLLLSSYVTSQIGIHAIFGAFIFGLIMPREPRAQLTLHVLEPVESAGTLFMPLFFMVTGLSVNARTLGWTGLLITVIVIAIACVGKMGGVLLAARAFGSGWRESAQLGALMNTRGLTEIVVLNIGLGIGILHPNLFAAFVFMALVTTAMTGPLLHVTLDRQPAQPSVREPAERTGQRLVSDPGW